MDDGRGRRRPLLGRPPSPPRPLEGGFFRGDARARAQVFHYSGAARRAGQSYQGALLCSEDGLWPAAADRAAVEAAVRACGLELWELYGHGPHASYMWSPKYADWARANPPPLDRIGDVSVTPWRARERARAAAAAR